MPASPRRSPVYNPGEGGGSVVPPLSPRGTPYYTPGAGSTLSPPSPRRTPVYNPGAVRGSVVPPLSPSRLYTGAGSVNPRLSPSQFPGYMAVPVGGLPIAYSPPSRFGTPPLAPLSPGLQPLPLPPLAMGGSAGLPLPPLSPIQGRTRSPQRANMPSTGSIIPPLSGGAGLPIATAYPLPSRSRSPPGSPSRVLSQPALLSPISGVHPALNEAQCAVVHIDVSTPAGQAFAREVMQKLNTLIGLRGRMITPEGFR